MAATTKQANNITLKGSSSIVSEFFFYAINNILYQRGIYPSEMFKQEKKYGLTILVTTDNNVLSYLKDTVLPQLTEWLEKKAVRRIVLVVRENETNETLERWQFNVENVTADKKNADAQTQKDINLINSEIRAVIRQITATITFLPLLEAPCSFDLLFYTDKNIEAPAQCEESSACLITNSEEVKLRSFSTSVHKVDGAVSYKFSM